MSGTITAEFFGSFEKSGLDETIKYLDKIGMKFLSGIEGEMFMIEVREMPQVIFALEAQSHHDQFIENKGVRDKFTYTWNILRMNDAGVCLYVAEGHPPQDGYVFIPMENIVAIHTLSKEFIERCSKTAVRTANERVPELAGR